MTDYPRIDVTADLVVVRRGAFYSVLLVTRKRPPFEGMLALPGGYVNADEYIIDAAVRELAEETGIHINPRALENTDIRDKPDRDPRGRVISHVFAVAYPEYLAPLPVAGDDAATADWYPMNTIKSDELAFDHATIIRAHRDYGRDKN